MGGRTFAIHPELLHLSPPNDAGRSKPGGRFPANRTRLPDFGGIFRDNLNEVLATGLTRIVVSRAIAAAADPATGAWELLAARRLQSA